MKKGQLKAIFIEAKGTGQKYIGVMIQTEGSSEPEVIINPKENFNAKFDYYMAAYDDDLILIAAKGKKDIRITGAAAGASFEDIQSQLIDEKASSGWKEQIADSMAHTLGAVYDTPHGVACAMMLPIVMEYNAECTGEKYKEIAKAMGVEGVDDMSVEEYRKAAVDAVRKLSVDVGIPTKLEALKEEDLQFLAESAHADACAPGNPKDASVEDLKDLFRKLM